MNAIVETKVRPWVSRACALSDASLVGEARRMATTLGRATGLEEARLGEVSVLVNEIGQNIVRHAAGRGEIVMRALDEEGCIGLELIGVDSGPGIANVTEARRDGFSTQGTPGTGLGAIERQAAEFDIYSTAGGGVIVLARVWNGRRRPVLTAPVQFGGICLPKPGETACGDAWRVVSSKERSLLLMVDGLGHGLAAAEAGRTAVEVFSEHSRLAPVRLAETLHAGLRTTRGAAVALTEVRHSDGELQFVGIGNIAGSVHASGGSRSFVSHNGTAGVEARRIQSLNYSWPAGALLVEHSDGIATSWDLSRYPGIRGRDASIVAAALYRDHRRVRDDATVIVGRWTGGAA